MVQLTHSPTDYSLAWQAALTIFLFILLTVAFNIYFAQHAPLAEGIVLFIHEIPANALVVCLAVALVLSAISFGPNTALQAILSVSNAALIFSYIVSIGSVRLKRLRGQPLLPSHFSLGKRGGAINDISLAFLLVGFVFSFFPLYPSVGDTTWLVDFNWAIIIFSGTCVLAGIYYVLGEGKRYIAPVSLVKEE